MKEKTMPDEKKIEILAVWDDEARVWVASSDDVPGLITEAETTEILLEKLGVLVPELLELSGSPPAPVRILLHSDRTILLPA
jgi:predicted RNase H-like HicB family nuclease